MRKNFHITDTISNFTETIKSNKRFPYLCITNLDNNRVIYDKQAHVIQFKDPLVKQICVETWGGHYFQGEITAKEAAAVTSLNGAFHGNTQITSFTELKYFTGLTGNWLQYPTTISRVGDYRGQFSGCTALKEIDFPSINLAFISGSFHSCPSLKEVDMSNVTITATSSAGRRFSVVFAGCSSIKKIILPQHWAGALSNFYLPFNGCSSLEYIDFGNVDFSALGNISATGSNEGFNPCSSLTTIKNGLYNLKGNLRLLKPVTRETVLEIIDNVYNYRANGDDTTTKTITLYKNTTYPKITDNDKALATAKGWSIVSS